MTRVVSSLELPHALTGSEPIGIRKELDVLTQMYRESPAMNAFTDEGIIEDIFDNPEGMKTIVAYDKTPDGRFLEGFAQYLVEPDYDFAQINNVFVDNTGRNNGAGRALLSKIIADATQSGVKTVDVHATDTAIGFYERMGFKLDLHDDSEYPRMVLHLNKHS